MAIDQGRITVGGRPATKPGTLVAPGEAVSVQGPARRFASRGGEKLDAALDRFGVDPAGRPCLDAGAGTGGFTDVLLSRGAAHVVAVDVGRGQLDWRLRSDPRVTVMERVNVRSLRPEDLPVAPEVVVADLSFISLAKVLPALGRVAAPGADVVLLVKPQFEAGRADVGRGGVVADPGVWRRVIAEAAEACRREGLGPLAVMASPIRGPAGNVEFLLHARQGHPGGEVDAEGAIREAPPARTTAG